MYNKKDYLTILAAFVGSWILTSIVSGYIDVRTKKEIETIKANYEAELKEQGLLPKEEPRRIKTEIYIPVDRTGQANRADSTAMFLKSAQDTFGYKEEDRLETVDYGSQVDEYQQRVNAIKRAEAQKLQQQRAQQESLNRKINRPRPSQPRSGVSGVQSGSTRVNKLRTSSL